MPKSPEPSANHEGQLPSPNFNLPHIDRKIIVDTEKELKGDPGFEYMKVGLIFEGALDPRIATFIDQEVGRMSQFLHPSAEKSRNEAKDLLFREASLLAILILHQLSYGRGESWHTELGNPRSPIKFPNTVNYYDIPELRFSEEGFRAYESQIYRDSAQNTDYFKTQTKEVIEKLKENNRFLLGFLRKRKRRLSLLALTKHHYSPNKALELGQVSFEINTRIIHLLSHIYRTNQLNQTLEAS